MKTRDLTQAELELFANFFTNEYINGCIIVDESYDSIYKDNIDMLNDSYKAVAFEIPEYKDATYVVLICFDLNKTEKLIEKFTSQFLIVDGEIKINDDDDLIPLPGYVDDLGDAYTVYN